MEKKSKKAIIIGVTSILLITLTLLGLTYAYYRTRIIGNNSNEPSINVTSEVLEVTYQDGTSQMNMEGAIEPGFVWEKTFSVKNTGTATGEYSIILDNIENTMKRTDDWTYELKLGNEVVAEGILPSNKNNYKVLVSYATVDEDATNEYTLTVNYAELDNVDQSEDMGATLKMRVNIANIQSSWNGEINEPVLSKGMIPVKWNETNKVWVVTTKDDAEWYDYDNQLWANVMLSDGKLKAENAKPGDTVSIYETGSMFVWIPRYEYKIDSTGIDNVNTFAGTIDVNFIPVSQTTPSKGYDYVHPAFRGDASLGGWDTELNGIWVSKYEAGFQRGTVGADGQTVKNAADTVVYSDKSYSISPAQKFDSVSSTYGVNYLGQDLSVNNYKNAKMSYPVFRAATYSYNNMSANDNYIISRDMMNTDFYGLKNADTHMIKNSEWGAVAYLAHSNYGRAGEEVSVNQRNVDADTPEEDDTNWVYTVTGYTGEKTQAVNNATSGNSTTNNMTGVFDMSGGAMERVAGYVYSNEPSRPNNYAIKFGSAFTTYDDELVKNNNKYINAYGAKSNGFPPTFIFRELKDSLPNSGYGDAIVEVYRGTYTEKGNSYDGYNIDGAWFKDRQFLPDTVTPFIIRGGRYDGHGGGTQLSEAGLFAIYAQTGDGASGKTGFRVSIVVE